MAIVVDPVFALGIPADDDSLDRSCPSVDDAAIMLRKCVRVWNHVHSFIGSVDNCFSWTPYYALLAFLERLFGPSYGQALMFTLPVLASVARRLQMCRGLGGATTCGVCCRLGLCIQSCAPVNDRDVFDRRCVRGRTSIGLLLDNAGGSFSGEPALHCGGVNDLELWHPRHFGDHASVCLSLCF